MFAVTLVFALLAPTIDAYICVDDVASASLSDDMAAAASVSDPSDDNTFSGDNLCIHGHCQHPVGVYKIVQLALNHRADTKVSIGWAAAPPSAPQAELLRPPRA